MVRVALSDFVSEPDQVIEEAQHDGTKQRLRVQTDEAARRGIFDRSTFFVGAQMSWGIIVSMMPLPLRETTGLSPKVAPILR